MQRGEQGGFFRGVSGPRVNLGVVRPERGERNRRDDKFERRSLVDLTRRIMSIGLDVGDPGGGILGTPFRATHTVRSTEFHPTSSGRQLRR